MITNTIEEVLQREGKVIDVPVGNSMYPLLKHKRTAFVVSALSTDIRKNDVVLFKRNNNSYVLHRVVKLLPNNYLRIRGDNCLVHDDVNREEIIGIMVGLYKDKHYIDCKHSIYYRNYLLSYRLLFWIRKLFDYTRKLIKRIMKNDYRN